jgi:quercetin dioxygenase-like cupin family protein/ketosteroid isomerase-like protein
MIDPISTVMSIYDAFGRGDVPGILQQLDPDVRWDHGVRRTAVPYLVERTDVDGAAEFFRAVGEQLEISRFDVGTVVASGGDVMARIHISGRNRLTGLAIDEFPEVHHWVVGEHGRVVEFTHIGDWAAHEMAAPGAAPAGSVLRAVGDTIEVMVAGGQFEVFTVRGPRDSGPPPHTHPWREVYIGLTGEVEVTIDDSSSLLQPGQIRCVEPGSLHAYRILTDEATFFVITGGGRASGLFADLEANAPHGVPSPETLPQLITVAARNGVSLKIFADTPG